MCPPLMIVRLAEPPSSSLYVLTTLPRYLVSLSRTLQSPNSSRRRAIIRRATWIRPVFIHFPHRLRCCQDIFILIQPISTRGGLTFTEALILPTVEQHTASVPPWPTRVHRLCSDHSPSDSTSTLDPTDGMSCQLCHAPPTLSTEDPATCHSCHHPFAPPDFR